MKKLFFTAIAVISCHLVFGHIGTELTSSFEIEAVQKTKTDTVVFHVTEMGCKTDSKMVETALYRKRGVKSVNIVDEEITIVYYPDKVKLEDLKSAIENTGTCENPDAKVHKATIKTD